MPVTAKTTRCEFILEFARTDKPADPYAFRFEPQTYDFRKEDGTHGGAVFPWDAATLADLAALQQPRPDHAARQRIGERLRTFLGMAGWEASEIALCAAAKAHRPIHVTVRSAAAELHALPWDLCTLRPTGQHLGELPRCLVRYEWPGTETAAPVPDPPTEGGRILFAWSGAGGDVWAAEHVRALRRACERGHHPFDEARDVVPRASLSLVRDALAVEGSPVAVLHVLCHGGRLNSDTEGYGLVWDASEAGGEPETLSAYDLRKLLEPHLGSLRLVVLAACHGATVGEPGSALGGVAQALHRIGVPAVVASRRPLSVMGSIALAEILYERLLVGLGSLEEAFLAAREKLAEDATTDDWSSLQLYARAEDGPDHRPIVFKPYRGLEAFRAIDRRFFLGRGSEVEALVARLRSGARLLTVLGASGSGKSSLVLAGVVPAVLDGALGERPVRVRMLRPGAHPSAALAAAMAPVEGRNDDAELLIVVDQLEELFTQGVERAEADAFVAALLGATTDPGGRVRAVLTLRADFLGRCLDFDTELGARVTASHEIVEPMKEAALREAIEKPAMLVGLGFQDGVIDALLERVASGAQARAGNLPLLGFALEALWERRMATEIPWAAWVAVGGVKGAIAKRAEEAFDSGRNAIREKTAGDPDQLVLKHRVDPATVYLTAPAAAPRQLHGVPELPPHYLPRPAELDRLRALVVGEGSAALGLTGRALRLGVQGMGGVGKSVLAAALARDEEVQARFPDGVFWVTLGQTPSLLSVQVELCRALGAAGEVFAGVKEGQARLGELLADRACLVVVDDAWSLEAVTALGATGPRGRVLVTTRDAGILMGLGAAGCDVDVMEEGQALALLARWAEQDVEGLPEVAREVARECGRLPLALAMVAASVRGRPDRWANALHKLQTADLGAIKRAFPDYPYPDLLKAIQVSVDALGPGDREWYLDFAVFPEDVAVPEAVLVTLWKAGGLEADEAQDVLDRLESASLLRREEEEGRYRLHDLQRDYVVKYAGAPAALHGRLVDAYAAVCPGGWASGPEDGYFFGRLTWHMKAAGRPGEVRELLLTYDWLRAKLQATDVNALLGDFGHGPEDRSVRLVEGAVRLSAHIIGPDRGQLAPQLLGRLLDQDSDEMRRLLTRAAEMASGVWLRPVTASLTRPGGPLLRTLEGHSSYVVAVAVTPDGRRAVSGSWDNTPKVWDLSTGQVLHTLEGHSSSVMAVAVTPDGRRAVLGSSDATLKVWDLSTGQVLHTLEGHSSWVLAVAVTPDGRRAVSASRDKTLKVWDLSTGQVLHTLEGHSSRGLAVAVTPDGRRAVSGWSDNTLKVWDLSTGQVLQTLEGHSWYVGAVAVTPDGRRAVSGSWDKTLKLWDLSTGQVLHTLEGHSWYVDAVAVTPDGRRAVSGSWDKTLKLWDLSTGQVLHTLEGHSNQVQAVAVTPDGRRAVSGSHDKTLKVWYLSMGQVLHTLEGHSGHVYAVAVTPDGRRAVSGSRDKTLKVWDLSTGQVLHTLEGHSNQVQAVAVTPDGRRAVSGSWDKTLKVWDLSTGQVLHTLEGHSSPVEAVAVTPDGRRAVSGPPLNTLKVWDLSTGQVLHTLEGHSNQVQAVAVTPDGRRAVSGSHDKTLKVWDLSTGQVLHTLEGHSGEVMAVAVTPDGRRAVSGSRDKTLKVWDLSTGQVLHTLEGHSGHVYAVAVTPDGQRAVSASLDETLKVWDLSTGQVLHTLEEHSESVEAMAVTPDGRRAVSGSSDHTLKVWDLRTGLAIHTFHGEAPMCAVAVAPDGRTIIAGDSLGRLHFLRLECP
jgi:WD40 repeat protein